MAAALLQHLHGVREGMRLAHSRLCQAIFSPHPHILGDMKIKFGQSSSDQELHKLTTSQKKTLREVITSGKKYKMGFCRENSGVKANVLQTAEYSTRFPSTNRGHS